MSRDGVGERERERVRVSETLAFGPMGAQVCVGVDVCCVCLREGEPQVRPYQGLWHMVTLS